MPGIWDGEIASVLEMGLEESDSICYWMTSYSSVETWHSRVLIPFPNLSIRPVVFMPLWLLRVYSLHVQAISPSLKCPQSRVVLQSLFSVEYFAFLSLHFAVQLPIVLLHPSRIFKCSCLGCCASSSGILPSQIVESVENKKILSPTSFVASTASSSLF